MRGIGLDWERRAERYLRRRGLTPVTRNFHCRGGEIDLVMRDGDAVVFVEVKYRRGGRSGFGDGADAVTAGKRERIRRAAGLFLARYPELAERPCRFDVISIQGGIIPRYCWINNAFDADEP